jgi:hypothetical protein
VHGGGSPYGEEAWQSWEEGQSQATPHEREVEGWAPEEGWQPLEGSSAAGSSASVGPLLWVEGSSPAAAEG